MGHRICLVVDDEPAVRTYLQVVLTKEGFQSIEAQNATEALRIAQKLGDRLDLVVTDIKMPGDMDGLDLAFSIRHSFPMLPIMLISGYADAETVRKAAAVFPVVQKPFTLQMFLASVQKVIGVAKAATA